MPPFVLEVARSVVSGIALEWARRNLLDRPRTTPRGRLPTPPAWSRAMPPAPAGLAASIEVDRRRRARFLAQLRQPAR
jgi:hypothetical protein